MNNIEQLHKVDLYIVKNVVEICDKYNLKYYMLGGTMLGAIRHKGFIPWDDDIDLGLPRKDYERFLELSKSELKEPLKLVNYKTDEKYHYYITRILHTKTKVVEERIEDINKYTNASIDIFPIDGTPNNYFMRQLYFFRVLYHRALMSMCYKNSIDKKRRRGFYEKVLLKIMSLIPIEKLTTPTIEKNKIDELLKKQDVSKSKYIGNIMGAYRTREIVPKEYYGEGKYYKFEDLELRGLERYDDYLKYTYGDYMKIPPQEQQKTHFKILELDGNTCVD